MIAVLVLIIVVGYLLSLYLPDWNKHEADTPDDEGADLDFRRRGQQTQRLRAFRPLVQQLLQLPSSSSLKLVTKVP